jgi:hypothetical protein
MAAGLLGLAAAGCVAPVAPAMLPTAPPPPASRDDQRQAAQLRQEAVAAMQAVRRGTAGPDGAAALFEAAAMRGDPEAQLILALGHMSGVSGAPNLAAALPLLHRAAQQGLPEAQYRLAQALEAGQGVRRDVAWAAMWFGRAAERGHAEAQFALALLRILGEGIEADEADALARLRAAERAGVAPARRYREALQRRVAPAAAREAEARLRREATLGPVREPDRPLLRFMQSGLAHRGAWPLRADGADGPQLRAAIEAFARREGLPPGDPFGVQVIDRLRQGWLVQA